MNENPYCTVTCSHCLSGTDVTWEEVGGSVICPACGLSFVAEPPPPELHPGKDQPPGKTWPAWAVMIVAGLLCLLVASFLWQISIRQPLEQMIQRVPEVAYSMRRVLFIPLFALGGAALALTGLLGMLFKERLGWPGLAGQAVIIAIFVLFLTPGWFLNSWFEGEMEDLGYESGGRGLHLRVIPIPVQPLDFPRAGLPIAGPEMKGAAERFDERVK